MTNDGTQKVNAEIQRLAEILITLDPVRDREHALSIRTNIIESVYGFVRERDYREYVIFDKKSQVQTHEDFIYFRFVRKCIAADIFYQTIIELLSWNDKKNKWGYQPVRAGKDGPVPFLGALYYLLSKRGILEGELRQLQDGSISNSLDEIRERMGNADEIGDWDPSADYEEYCEGTIDNADGGGTDALSEFERFLCLVPFIAERVQMERHLGKSKRHYAEGFYTFDAVKLTKNGLFDGGDVIEANAILFPVMEELVMTHLLLGQFTSTRNVVENPVRDAKRLKQRNGTIEVCYGLSHPTVSKKKDLYDQLFMSVISV